MALLVALAAAAGMASSQPRPEPLRALEKRGLTIVGTLPASGGLSGYAAYMGQEPVALFVTPDGKHVIAGTLFDADGQDLTSKPLADAVAKPMAENAWRQLEGSRWIADGRQGARVIYAFTDPNCPYCNKLWSEARPWVDAGKLQLRHVMVGILTPTSAGKAAALLAAKDPVAALAAHEREHAGDAPQPGQRPRPLEGGSLKPLAAIPDAQQKQLESNARLMASLGLQATPSIVWRDENGALQVRQGVPPGQLRSILGAP